ncbi:MAG: HTH domain-containing protein [Oscillospiraceae bacterium]|nr:HTH domain-containing protein [Oscillospiraceae bacterium]
MKKRSADILLALLKQRQTISLDKLSKQYDVSVRTLLKDIQDINEFLKSIDQGHVLTKRNGLLVFDDRCDIKTIYEKMKEIDCYKYRLTQEERCLYISILLVTESGYITMEKIAEELYVNRMTILSDMDRVKKRLEAHGVQIETKSSKGIKLAATSEVRIRLVLIELFRSIIIDVSNEGFFQGMMFKKANLQIPLARFIDLMQKYRQENDIYFSNHVFYENVLYLFVSFNRLQNGYGIIDSYNPVPGYTNSLLAFIAGEEQVTISQNEKNFYSQYVEMNQLYLEVRADKNAELSSVLMYFLSKVSLDFGVAFEGDSQLFESLMQHINSLGISAFIMSFEEKDVHLKYDELYHLVNKNSFLLEHYLKMPLTEPVRKSIVIHLCASLIRNRSYLENASVLISCPGSVAMGKLMEAQIKNHFNFKIVAVVPASHIEIELQTLGREVDFVISTVPLTSISHPVIVVSPLLELTDLNTIQRQTFQLMSDKNPGQEQQHSLKESLKKDMEEILNGMDQEAFYQTLDKIQTAVHAHRKFDKNPNVDIAKMLTPAHIRIETRELSWEEALRTGGEMLEGSHYSAAYIERMIENVRQYGPYFVLSPKVALAHAGADCGVYQEGLSLLVSKQGICFDGDSKVHLLFFFCTAGKIAYMKLFHEIIKIGKNGTADRVLALNTSEEVFCALTHCTER